MRESRGLPGSPEDDAQPHAGRDQDAPIDHENGHFERHEVVPQHRKTDERCDR